MPRFPRRLVVLMLVIDGGAVVVRANAGSSLGLAANIVVLVTFAAAIVFFGLKWWWWRHRRHGDVVKRSWKDRLRALRRLARELWLWRFGPVEVTFFLPRRIYAEREFAGAPEKESFSTEALTIGVGVYDLTVCVKARATMTIDQLRVLVDDDGKKHRPESIRSIPPRFLRDAGHDHAGRPVFMDWSGELKVASDIIGYPQRVAGSDYVLWTLRIKTSGRWSGTLVVVVQVSGHFTRTQQRELALAVTEDPKYDQAPFLKLPDPDMPESEQAQDLGGRGS